ncbi:MAG: DUF349 domain-containing protein, partial [Acidimicrobiia bacterium]
TQSERALKDIRRVLQAPAPLASKREQHSLIERYRTLYSQFYPRVRELREMEEWHRWANAGVQESLCERMENLVRLNDASEAARQMRDLQAQWKQVAVAPRSEGDTLWRRFKTARDRVSSLCEAYFAERSRQWTANLKQKEGLLARAQALAGSTDWRRATDEIRRLQTEWKAVGPAPHAQERLVFEGFQKTCNQFFKARRENRERQKAEWARHYEQKDALCARVEQLADSTDWDSAAAEIARLQQEWKTVGPVRKALAEPIWQRFQSACDRFVARYEQRDQLELEKRLAEPSAICRDLESLLPSSEATPVLPPSDLAAFVQERRTRWQHLQPLTLLPRQHAEALLRRFTDVCARLVETYPESFRDTDLDPEVNRRKMEQLCLRVESFLAEDEPEVAESSAALLARQIKRAIDANSLGGRVDDQARWKASVEQVRSAQAAWKRLGPVPGEAGRSLKRRFENGCSRFFQQLPAHTRDFSARPARSSSGQRRG